MLFPLFWMKGGRTLGILVFGVGKCFETYKYWLDQLGIVALLDNDKKKQAQGKMYGHMILSPARGIELDFDYIYVLGKYAQDMRRELLELGVKNEFIHTINDLINDIMFIRGRIKPMVFQAAEIENDKRKKNILLISHSLGLSGAVVACQSLGIVLKNSGYNVTIACALDGAMRGQMLNDGISVICDVRLKSERLSDIEWVNDFQMVWINTVAMFHLLVEHNPDIPIIWWIHESEMIYQEDLLDQYNEMFSTYIDFTNVHIYGVSELANGPFLRRWPYVEKIDILPLGVDDFFVKHGEQIVDSPFVFAVVGYLCKRKAQDVFLLAIEMLPDYIYRECEFWLIGGGASNKWGQDLYNKAEKMDKVKFCGQLTRSQMAEALERIDAIVVPSREETFSIAAVEGMMHGKAVICTDEQSVGVAHYVREAEAGLLVPRENARALSDAMMWAVMHRKVWQDMGKNGRLLYENCFSKDVFSERVNKCTYNLLQG